MFGHLSGNTPKGVAWFLKEANFNHGASVGPQLAATSRPQFPPQEFDDEPIGLEFMRYREWDKIEKMLKYEAMLNGDEVEPPFGGDETVGMDDYGDEEEDNGGYDDDYDDKDGWEEW